ncbi:MAG: transposase [Candidatus Dormibacteraceae bacterium]
METAVMPGQNGSKKRGRWSAERKLAVLQEWQQGLPVAEVCRRHGLHANQLYRWRKALDQGLRNGSDLIPKSQISALQKKVDELERALGRKALEVDVLKKAFELKVLKLPEGM